MSIASQPDERADVIDVYLGHRGEGTLALALTPAPAAGARSRVGAALQRVTSAVLRGGLTSWVQVGMLVREMRGRSDPLTGLGQHDTFLALCRLVQAATEAQPLTDAAIGAQGQAHVQLFATPYAAAEAVERIQRVLSPYAAAGTVTPTGRAVIAWFAIRHLIAARRRDYSLQVVHLAVDGVPGGQLSLMLPRDPEEERAGAVVIDLRDAAPAATSAPGATSAPPVSRPATSNPTASPASRRSRRGRRPAGPAPGTPPSMTSTPAADVAGLQAYLDAYREHLTRELLLEPVVSTGSAAEFAWTPEPTGDGGVAVAGTVPGSVADHVVLRMAEHAVAQLGERSPRSAGIRLGDAEPDGDLLVQRWAVGAGAGYVLSVAARSGDRRRPTQVLIHFAAAADQTTEGVADPTPTPPGGATVAALRAPPYEPPRSGPAVDEARALTVLPLWWHSADARCDGNDVILYEMPFRGQRLRVRANDYPAEPMYTLLVGDPGAEVAAVDLEHWPSSWVRPRAF